MILTEIVNQLKSCGFQCEGGPLENNVAFIELDKMAKTEQNREMHLYQCDDCVLVFGVETAYEDHSQIVCPICLSDDFMRDAGCAIATVTRGPETE